jgi:predicted nucleic-acid-binding protein
VKALDTNVIVRFLTQDDPDQAAKATALMQGLSAAQPALVPVVVWVETYRVLTRAYGIENATGISVLSRFAGRDEIVVESAPVISEALDSALKGADLADAVIASSARHAGCSSVVTFDQQAAKTLGFELL